MTEQPSKVNSNELVEELKNKIRAYQQVVQQRDLQITELEQRITMLHSRNRILEMELDKAIRRFG